MSEKAGAIGSHFDGLRITHSGIKEVENALTKLQNRLHIFPQILYLLLETSFHTSTKNRHHFLLDYFLVAFLDIILFPTTFFSLFIYFES